MAYKNITFGFFLLFNCFKHQEPHRNKPLAEKEINKKSCLHKLELDELGELSVTVVLKRKSFGFADLAALYDFKISLDMLVF